MRVIIMVAEEITRAAWGINKAGGSLIPHRLPGVRGELAPPGHDDDERRCRQQDPGADEPAEIAEREEEGALAAVEVPPGGFEQARRAHHMGFGFRRVAL